MEELTKYTAGGEPLVQTTVARRNLKMLLLLKQEVDRLVEGYSSPCLGLLGLSFGAFVSLFVTDLTANMGGETKRYFVDATVITALSTLMFLWLAIREWQRARNILADLEKEKTVEVDVSVVTKSSVIGQKI